MKLQQILYQEFDSIIRARGKEYFSYKRVRYKKVTQGTAEYVVSGSNDYKVTVSLTKIDQKFKLTCTCPYFDDELNCKHLWAAILDVDARGLFDSQNGLTETSQKMAWLQRITEIESDLKSENQAGDREKNYDDRQAQRSAPRMGIYILNPVYSSSRKKIILHFYCQERLKNGSYGKLKRAEITHAKIEFYESPEERKILWDLLGKTSIDESYYFSSRPVNTVTLMSEHAKEILIQISQLGKLYFQSEAEVNYSYGTIDLQQLAKVTFDPLNWILRLEINHLKNNEYELTGQLMREQSDQQISTEGHQRLISEIVGFYQGLTFFKDQFAETNLADNLIWYNLIKDGPVKIDQSEINSFFEYYQNTKNHNVALVLPENLHLEEITHLMPRCQLMISTDPQTGRLKYDLSFLYNTYKAEINTGPFIYDFTNKVKILRHLEFEKQSFEKFSDQKARQLDLIDFIEQAFLYDWSVFYETKKINPSGQFNIHLESGLDWFDLNMDISSAEQLITMPAILQAIKNGQRLISLGDGSQALLSSEWINKVRHFLDIGTEVDGKIRLNKIQALFLSSELSENIHFQSQNRLTTFQNLIADIKNAKPVKPDKKFKGVLRSYQQQGLSWLQQVTDNEIGGILADDMGLGKTIQILALLSLSKARATKQKDSKIVQTSLIVVPKSLIFNWQVEVNKFAPHLSVLVYTGVNREFHRKELATLAKNYDLVLTTYHTLRLDIEFFRKMEFNFFILDEAQNIKNEKALVSMSARLISARKKMALTGTPIENSLTDLFSILSVVMPGLIKTAQADRWAKEKNLDTLKKFGKSLSPFILRRTKTEVLKDLPEKSEQILYVELNPDEAKKYNQLKKFYWAQLKTNFNAKGLAKSKIEILEALLRLRQMSCHPGLIDKQLANVSSSKFDVVLEQLESVIRDGHKALVFSQFTSLLELFAKHLQRLQIKYEYLDGKTINRQERVKTFQEQSDISVFLLSLKVGGVGLNLTAADYVFILDPWWNPAAESQAIDRTHRIGQKRKVFAYKVIAKDTVEEKILKMQTHKKELAESIISANSSLLKSIKLSDLEDLFS